MNQSPDAHLSYCADLVRHYDRDRFLTGLFAPPGRREALFAIYAFNHEVAKIPEVVTEPIAGQIRLQWWRESLDGVYAGQPRAHQVAVPLAEAVTRHDLSRAHFEAILDARERDLDEMPPESLDDLEGYAAATSGALVQLALEVLDVRDSASLTAGRHIGVAWALIGLIRAVPFHAAQRRLMLPGDLAGQAQLDLHDLFELRRPAEVRPVVRDVAAQARAHLDTAAAHRNQVPRQARPALLPATLARGYLDILAKADHDPFDARVQMPLPGRAWRLLWASTTGRW